MSPEDDEPQDPHPPADPSDQPVSETGAPEPADVESPTSWAAPGDEAPPPEETPSAGLPTDAGDAAPYSGPPEADAYPDADAAEPYEAEAYAAEAYEPEAYEAEAYEAEAYEAATYEPETYGEGEAYDAEQPDPVAAASRRPPARRPPTRRPAATRAPAGRRPAPSRATASPRAKRAAPAPEKPDRRATVILLSVLTLAVVALAIWGFSLSRKADEKSGPTASTAPSTTLVTLPEAAFVTYEDLETHFTMRYPRGWHRTEVPNREIRLQVTDGRQYAVRVQVRRTEVATTPANVGNLEPVMSGLIVGDSRVLSRDPVTINGLIGFRYIYTFVDEAGLEEAHIHYFLFQGHKLHSIVFAAPSSEFARIEGVFDQMINSFRSEPEPETTTPPTTG